MLKYLKNVQTDRNLKECFAALLDCHVNSSREETTKVLVSPD